MADPLFFSTPLALPFNGADGATQFPNYGFLPLTITPSGNAKISTAQSVHGGSSLLIDGVSDYLIVPASYAWAFGTDDFTVEVWAMLLGTPNLLSLLAGNYSGALGGWGLGLNNNGAELQFRWGDTHVVNLTIPSGFGLNTFRHLAVTREKGVLRGWVGGAQVGADTPFTDNITRTTALGIGSSAPAFPDESEAFAHINSMRITRHAARYSAPFTPPGPLDLVPAPLAPIAVSSLLTLRNVTTNPVSPMALKAVQLIRDMENGGMGRIAGTVKEAGSPLDVPVSRRVRLHRKRDGVVVRETWSKADGTYSFENIQSAQDYYVVSFDHTGDYNAAIKDAITPELMV